jgi:hypothetical protein
MTMLLHSSITQILLTVALSGTSVARAWIGCRKEILIEQLRNRRLASALRSTKPDDRPDIITASAYLETSRFPASRSIRGRHREGDATKLGTGGSGSIQHSKTAGSRTEKVTIESTTSLATKDR